MRDKDVDTYLKDLHREARGAALRKLEQVCATTIELPEGLRPEQLDFEELHFACWGRSTVLNMKFPLGTSAEEMYANMIVQLRLEGFPVSENV
jgi:hypothetical protein